MSTITVAYKSFRLRKLSRALEDWMLNDSDAAGFRAKRVRDWASYCSDAWIQSNGTQPAFPHTFFGHRYRNRKTREVLNVMLWVYPNGRDSREGYERLTEKIVEVPERVKNLSQVTRETKNVKEMLESQLAGECFEQRRRGVFGRVAYRFIVFKHSATVWSVGLARRGEPPEWEDVVELARRQREKLERVAVKEE